MKRSCIRFGRPSCRTWGARPDGRMISGILSRASLRRSAVGLSLRDARPAVCAQTACPPTWVGITWPRRSPRGTSW